MNKKVLSIGLLIAFVGVLALSAAGCTSQDAQAAGSGQRYGQHDASTGDTFEAVQGQGRGAGGPGSADATSHDNDQGGHSPNGGGELQAPNGQGKGQGGNGRGAGGGGRGGGSFTGSLSEAEAQALVRAIEEEYGAQALYQSVLDTFGQVEPFDMIVQSEAQHAAALVRLAEKYGVPVPEFPGTDGLPVFDTLEAACQAGVEAEIADAALYDELMTLTDKPDLLRVFENLQRASLENHLPAFEACGVH